MQRAVQTSVEDKQCQQRTALPQGSLASTGSSRMRPGPVLHQGLSAAGLLGQAALLTLPGLADGKHGGINIVLGFCQSCSSMSAAQHSR